MNEVTQYIESHRTAFEADLSDILRIASVSADSRQQGEVRRAAEWMASQLRQLGLGTELIETAGHPLIYAETPAVAGAPVALVYGHYDVQPPEPLEDELARRHQQDARADGADLRSTLEQLDVVAGLGQQRRNCAAADTEPDHGDARARDHGCAPPITCRPCSAA